MPFDHTQDNLKRLKKDYAEGTKRTVFFIGAGCSVEVGLPSWQKLADDILAKLDRATPSSAMDDEMLERFFEVEGAHEDRDYWTMFDLVETHWKGFYEDYLNTEFSEERMRQLDIPIVYEKIWKMRNIQQVMTLNIDGLLARAYSSVNPAKALKLMEYPGRSITDSQHSFSKNHPTLLNLHGDHAARSTWVMTKAERKKLFESFEHGSYKQFLRHIFSVYNVVFIGVNLLDDALSPIIEELARAKLLTNHYWLTANISPEANRWAQANAVRVITYTPEVATTGERVDSTVICAMLDEIEQFQSFDQEVVLPELERVGEEGFPTPAEMVDLLNTDRPAAMALLSGRIEDIGRNTSFDQRAINRFLTEYDIAVQMALVIGKSAPHDRIIGRRLVDKISASQSSSVWLVEEPGVQPPSFQILKFLNAQAQASTTERESFRRGIESLFYLKDTNTAIAPKYITHTNMPLALVMEQIEGVSLEEIRKSAPQVIKDHWLEIFTKVCTAVEDCHLSDGRVLHRDLKPQNILLSGVGWDADAKDIRDAGVKLINFDMSWHKLSSGDTKSISAEDVGYFAPEQRNFANSESPRNARTDVYMLGMVLFSLISTSTPPGDGAKNIDWKDLVKRQITTKVTDKLVANRTARLILRMTERDTKDRPDMREVITELETIDEAVRQDWQNATPELFVEKILVDSAVNYEWSEVEMKGRVAAISAYNLELSFNNRGQVVKIHFERTRDQSAQRRNFSANLRAHVKGIEKDLQQHGWSPSASSSWDSAVLDAGKKARELQEDVEGSVAYVAKIIGQLMKQIN